MTTKPELLALAGRLRHNYVNNALAHEAADVLTALAATDGAERTARVQAEISAALFFHTPRTEDKVSVAYARDRLLKSLINISQTLTEGLKPDMLCEACGEPIADGARYIHDLEDGLDFHPACVDEPDDAGDINDHEAVMLRDLPKRLAAAQAYLDAGGCFTTPPAPEVKAEAGQSGAEVVRNLIELARASYHLLDNTEDNGEYLSVDRSDFDDVSKMLDKLDELSDDQPGYIMGPAAKAEWALRDLLATPPPEAGYAAGLETAAKDVLAERRRQVEGEGWTPDHDDEHVNGEMAMAAACYAAPAPIRCEWQIVDGARSAGDGSAAFPPTGWLDAWPWDRAWWKPKDRRHDLVRAGALIIAEIERLDRAVLKQGAPDHA